MAESNSEDVKDHISNVCTCFFRIQMSLYLYTPDRAKILEQKHWWVKILVVNFLPPSPTMPAMLPLTKIILFCKGNSKYYTQSDFCGLCISGFSILHKRLKSLTCTGVGIHTVTSPLNLFLFLEHWAPGIDMVQMFPCLYILALRKLCYTPKNIMRKHFCWSHQHDTMACINPRMLWSIIVTAIIFHNKISVQSIHNNIIKPHSFQTIMHY